MCRRASNDTVKYTKHTIELTLMQANWPSDKNTWNLNQPSSVTAAVIGRNCETRRPIRTVPVIFAPDNQHSSDVVCCGVRRRHERNTTNKQVRSSLETAVYPHMPILRMSMSPAAQRAYIAHWAIGPILGGANFPKMRHSCPECRWIALQNLTPLLYPWWRNL